MSPEATEWYKTFAKMPFRKHHFAKNGESAKRVMELVEAGLAETWFEISKLTGEEEMIVKILDPVEIARKKNEIEKARRKERT